MGGTMTYEGRQLINGKLVESSTDAIGTAARRAFDETSWAEDASFRAHCLEQLGDAMERVKEELRTALVLETGCSVMLTHVVQIEKGFFVEPTLFADVDPDSTIAQDEIFGPGTARAG